MKKLVTTVFILIINLCYAQEKSKDLQIKLFNTNIEEMHFSSNNLFSKSFLEIKDVKELQPKNNSEGKFPKYKIVDVLSNLNDEKLENTSLNSESQSKFIDNLINEKLEKINKNYQLNDKTYYNKFDDINRFTTSIEKLNKVYKVSETIKIEIGNNIYNFINKLCKSELDNTLQNSLNLFAIRL